MDRREVAVRGKAFAHVVVARERSMSAYRDMTVVTEPATVLTFRPSGDELPALTHAGAPFYRLPWRRPSSAWCSRTTPTGTRWPSW